MPHYKFLDANPNGFNLQNTTSLYWYQRDTSHLPVFHTKWYWTDTISSHFKTLLNFCCKQHITHIYFLNIMLYYLYLMTILE